MVVVGELTLERAREALHGELADVVYSDPPWGPGMLRYFRTINGERRRPDWCEFLGLFCEVVAASRKAAGHVLIEMGPRWVDDLCASMLTVGILQSARFDCFYGSKRLPVTLWYSGPGIHSHPEGLHGSEMTLTALRGVCSRGSLVFDPCCGKGMTARCASRLGMRFAGVELNPKRAEVCKRWLDNSKISRTK